MTFSTQRLHFWRLTFLSLQWKKTEINKSTLHILILIQFALQIFAFQNLYFLWSLFHKATVFTFDILKSAATDWNQFPGTVCFKNPSWSPFSCRFVRTCTFRGLVPICGCPQEIYLPFAHFHLWLIFSCFYQISGIQYKIFDTPILMYAQEYVHLKFPLLWIPDVKCVFSLMWIPLIYTFLSLGCGQVPQVTWRIREP